MDDSQDSPDVFDDEMDARFGQSVKSLRTARGMSQEQLARNMQRKGVRDAAPLTISRLESGRRKVRLVEAIALSRIFNVPITEMANESPTLNTLSLLGGMRRDLAQARSRFEHDAAEFANFTQDQVGAMLQIISEMRMLELDEEANLALGRFEWAALSALDKSLCDSVASYEWSVDPERIQDHELDSERLRELKQSLRRKADEHAKRETAT